MWVRFRWACLVFVTGIVLLVAAYGGIRSVAAQDSSEWLLKDAPTLSKIVDLPDNVPPDSNNTDCTKQLYIPESGGAPQTVCTFQSPLGTLTTSGSIQTGNNKFMRLDGPTHSSFFIPTTDASMAMVSLSSPAIGNDVGVYRNLTKASLRLNITYDETYYDVTAAPDTLLRDPISNEPLQVNADDIAFSTNGAWMVMDAPHVGLLRVNTSDLSVQLFAGSLEPDWFLGLAYPALAISNDGRYAAANTDIFGAGNLEVYDLSTCTSQLDIPTNKQAFCSGRDMWQGLLGQQQGIKLPTHIRFVNDDSISFSARYEVNGSTYKAASFLATAPGVTQHKLGLLGMGDSYISGQGAFDYRDGTDTANDPCHLSELAYPFILGKQYFNTYNSIACSGARTFDIIGENKKYKGQVTDKIPEDKRDKPSILANFMPGYIYQQEFASAYQPEAILLSVGGDDVGFADIVKACVANTGGGTCYNTYEDRAEVVNEIDATYGKLVNTYTTLREQSGGARLYVVGYPQIAKPGGDCGLNVHLNSDEVAFSAQLIDYLDSVVQRAAQTAGVFYVNTQQAFDGHRLCEAPAGQSAMNGFTVGNDAGVTFDNHVINFIGAESYHPTALGYQLLAANISKQTNNLTADMPSPAPYKPPVFDWSLPFLQGVPSTGRTIAQVSNDDTMTDDFIVRGSAENIAVNGAGTQLQPGSPYQVVLHSNPVLLDEGGVSSEGNVTTTVHIPADTVPGYHTLHVYGTNMAGEHVDIQKVLYIAASADDYDGDGVPNSTSVCLLLPLSGQDVDNDGIDDACDPDISLSSKTIISGQVTTDTTVQAKRDTSGAPTTTDPNATQPNGTVLGDAMNVPSSPGQGTAALQFSPGAQKLFRLNWTTVLTGGGVLTMAGTLLYYCIRRE